MMLVIGRNGQLARALYDLLGDKADYWSREDIDLTNLDSLKQKLSEVSPTAIINATAYTAVDKAEKDEAVANAVNADAVALMAQAANDKSIPFVHVSTDYVFDGSGDNARTEDAPTAPLGAYGRSKLKGEQAVKSIGGDYLIFRTSWVYDATGANFMNTMLRLGAERETLNIVADQIGAPSYAPHLAQAMVEALNKAQAMTDFPSGIYHLCNGGETSWHGFATEIFGQARAHGAPLAIKQVVAIPSSEYPTPAARPLNSRLNCEKLHKVFDIRLPSWQEGLKECLEAKYENRKRTA